MANKACDPTAFLRCELRIAGEKTGRKGPFWPCAEGPQRPDTVQPGQWKHEAEDVEFGVEDSG